ncbi:hypothetical protein TNCV_4286501 [Trichonephila clavipes]|nr:hypothetical protein TNCV_4286501 [Trichonephila clavipes]
MTHAHIRLSWLTDIQRLEWPDLNPIEHVRDVLGHPDIKMNDLRDSLSLPTETGHVGNGEQGHPRAGASQVVRGVDKDPGK